MKKHQLLALLLVFAMIASIISATFIFAEAESSNDPVVIEFTKKNAKVGNYDLVYYSGGQTLSADASSGMNFRWVPVIVCDASGKVIRIARNLTGEKNVEVPADGFAIAVHFGPDDDTNLDVKAYLDDLCAAAGKGNLEGVANEVADVTVDWQVVLNDDLSGATLYRGPAPEQPKVEPDELIGSFGVNTGAVYAGSTHTILARIGENKTISDITGYLDASRDYNYFYVYAAEADANGNYVITAEYEVLGRPDGVKSDVEVPENGFLVCLHAADEAATPMNDKINVGDIVVLENVDLDVLAALKPGENPLAGVGKVSFYTAKEVEPAPEQPKVEPDELIGSFGVNTGAVYAGSTHTILARIGENKTISDITGYLDASRDYNYFYVYAAEADANGNYIITAEYEVLGRPDGVKSDVEVPENGFLVCLHAADEAATPMNDKINVGDIVVLENIDLDVLAALQPGENPLEGVGKVSFYTAKEVEDGPVGPTNVALGKEVEIKKAQAIPQYSEANLTDGKIATTMGWGTPADEWFSFYYNENYADQVNIERVDGKNVGFFVVDLAGYYDVDSVRIHYNKDYLPETTNIYTSKDGKTYTKVINAAPKASDGEVVGAGCWIDFPLEEVATAKYVKVEFIFSGMFAMLDEVEVYGVPADYTREPAGEVVIDGKLGDSGYDDAAWVKNSLWQGRAENDVKPTSTGKYTVRADEDYIVVAVEILNANGLNMKPGYAPTYDPETGAITGFVQSDATNFRIWLATNDQHRSLVDVQYFGKEHGFVYANFGTTDTSLSKPEVLYVVTENNGTLTAEIAIKKSDLGITDSVSAFVTYSDPSFTDATHETGAYNALQITNSAVWDNDYYAQTNRTFYQTFLYEDISVVEIREMRTPAGEVLVDGVLDDSTYEDETAAPWVDNGYLQNAGAPQPDLSGKFTARADGKYITVAVQINGALAPNITADYAAKIAASGLAANGAQTSTYVQTGATTFRIWLRTNDTKRYLIDVQYLGEGLGWVATRAIFPEGSTLTWDDLVVIPAVKYNDGVLTAEIAFLKAQFGVVDDFAMFVTYSDNFTDETYTDPTYQCLHICSDKAEIGANGYITNFSGDTHTAPYIAFSGEFTATEGSDFLPADYSAVEEALNAAKELDETIYNEESWKALQAAIAAVVEGKMADEQKAVDAMAKAINDALAGLTLKDADYSSIKFLLAVVDKMLEKNYTAESWANLMAAIEAVDYSKKIDEQAAVDAMAKAIADAILALEIDESAPETSSDSSSEESSDTSSEESSDTSSEESSDTSSEESSDTSSEESSDTSSEESSDTSSEESSDASSEESSDASSEEIPSTSSEVSPSAPSNSDSPETGDSGIVIFALLAVLSLAGAIVAVRVRH